MNKSSIIFLFILIAQQLSAQSLIPYLKLNGKYIFVDSASMKPVIEKEFDEAIAFTDGFACVKLNGKYGYIDKTGKQLTDFKYDEAFEFINGLAKVFLDNKASFIDTSGKEIFPFKYPGLSDFKDGVAFAMLDEKWGYVDRTGNEVVPVIYDWITDFSEGLAKVELGGKYGFVNKNGSVVIPLKYEDANDFVNGLAAVKINGKYGFIDKKDKVIIPPKYHFAIAHPNGLIAVTVDSGRGVYRRGYIDKTGKVIIPVKYSDIREFTKGVYLVKLGNRIQLINSANKKLAEWDKYETWRSISEGIAFLEIKKGLPDAGKWEMINSQGKEISPTAFEVGDQFKNGIASVKIDGKWGFIDKTGKPLFDSKYDNSYSFNNKRFTRVQQNGKWFYINIAGKEYREKPKPLAAGWLFHDEFKDNRHGWGIDTVSKDFQTKLYPNDNSYSLSNKSNDLSQYILRKIPGWNEKNNFRIEITIQYLAGPANMGNGLIIGCDEKISSYYRMLINNQGGFRIDQSIIGKVVPHVDWKDMPEIIKHGYNKLGFTHINGIWTFYINEKKVHEMKAKEFFGKEIGLFIGPGSSYACKSFKVYDWTVAAKDPAGQKEPLYEAVIVDNFKKNRFEWDENNDQDVTASFTNEAFRIKNKFDGYYMPSIVFSESDVKAFRVELIARHVEGVKNYGYGLCFGKKDINNTFVFYISLNGYFSVYRVENGNWSALKEWAETDAIYKTGYSANKLRIVNDVGKWEFYINDKLVYSQDAGTMPGKEFGCIVANKQTIDFTRFSFARIVYPTAQGF